MVVIFTIELSYIPLGTIWKWKYFITAKYYKQSVKLVYPRLNKYKLSPNSLRNLRIISALFSLKKKSALKYSYFYVKTSKSARSWVHTNILKKKNKMKCRHKSRPYSSDGLFWISVSCHFIKWQSSKFSRSILNIITVCSDSKIYGRLYICLLCWRIGDGRPCNILG